MQINADFDARVTVHSGAMDWVPSPMQGVERRMLDRIGGEVARATSIVRYAPKSHFSPHVHAGGEEFLVLEGVFEDEHGVFPSGTYVRNPPTSRHTPGSEGGCIIFVKLWQFDPDDRTQVKVDSHTAPAFAVPGRPGVKVVPLHRDDREDVRIEIWESQTKVTLEAPGGLELLVLEGSLREGGETFVPQSWLRLPKGGRLEAIAGSNGCRLWIKTGHLSEPPRAPAV